MDDLLIIGIDAAAQPENIALSRTTLRDCLFVDDVVPSCKGRDPAAVVSGWLSGASRALIAIDAPLGWPGPLAERLSSHRAGEPLSAPAHSLFRRTTDQVVHTRTGKLPLDVGADRIARAAHAALALVSDVRKLLNRAIPLAWSNDVVGIAAIEVYPAATLRALGVDPGAYKKPGIAGAPARQALVAALSKRVVIPQTIAAGLSVADDPIDAVVAAMAGADFALGHAAAPNDSQRQLAEREGWIWVR